MGSGVVGHGAGQVGCSRLQRASSEAGSWGFIPWTDSNHSLLSFQRLVHPFEIPEIFSLPMDQGDVHYLKWLEEGMQED